MDTTAVEHLSGENAKLFPEKWERNIFRADVQFTEKREELTTC